MITKKVCCVRNCPALNTPGLTYFTLPGEFERYKQWLNLIGRQDLVGKNPELCEYVICSAHFDKTQIGIVKETPTEALPIKHVPTKRKGVYIVSSTTATQTDFSSSSDDDDAEFGNTRKRKLVTNGKVMIYKNLKPNRAVFACCEIDVDNDIQVNNEIVNLVPWSLTRSENKPNDSVSLGNRKVFVLEDENIDKRKCNDDERKDETTGKTCKCNNDGKEDENPVKRRKSNDDGKVEIIVSNILEHNSDSESLPKVAIFKSGVNIPVQIYTKTPETKVPIPVLVVGAPLPTLAVDGASMNPVIVSAVPNCAPQMTAVKNLAASTSKATTARHNATSNLDENKKPDSDIVISNVVTLNDTVDNKTLNEFFDWYDRTIGRRRGPKYDKDFNLFALNLHTINSRAYRLLMDSLQLPTEQQLKDIQLNIGLGFDERVLRLLAQKINSFSENAKYCTLGVYAMALKPQFFYDPATDEVIGIRNVEGIKSRSPANYALIAMVRGLKVAWQLPVAFALLSSMSDMDYIHAFLIGVIRKMKNARVKILGLVMSDDDYFWKYCKTKHFFDLKLKVFLSIDTSIVYAVFDIPHVLNRFKDDFMENDLKFENKTISWKYIQQVYDIDKQRKHRLVPKLTEEHLAKSKDKSLKHPCQVLSRAVSAAMQFYIDHGLIEKEAIPTAEFIKKFNDLFDVLNSNTKTDPTSKELASVNLKALDNAYLMFKRLKKENSDGKDNSDEVESLKTLKYFIASLQSLTGISEALSNLAFNGITQSRLTYLEPLLKFVKSIQDETKTIRPTPIQFVKAYSKLILKHLVELTPPSNSIGNMNAFVEIAHSVKDSYEVHKGRRIHLRDTDYRFELPEVYAIIYVSSYLIYKCLESHHCERFEKSVTQLLDLNKTKTYVHFEKFNKNAVFYDRLKLPAMSFVSYVERLDNCFVEMFNEVYHTNPAEFIYGLFKKVPKWDFPCSCFPKDYLLKLFVRARIYQTVSENTKCLKKSSLHSLVAKKL